MPEQIQSPPSSSGRPSPPAPNPYGDEQELFEAGKQLLMEGATAETVKALIEKYRAEHRQPLLAYNGVFNSVIPKATQLRAASAIAGSPQRPAESSVINELSNLAVPGPRQAVMARSRTGALYPSTSRALPPTVQAVADHPIAGVRGFAAGAAEGALDLATPANIALAAAPALKAPAAAAASKLPSAAQSAIGGSIRLARAHPATAGAIAGGIYGGATEGSGGVLKNAAEGAVIGAMTGKPHLPGRVGRMLTRVGAEDAAGTAPSVRTAPPAASPTAGLRARFTELSRKAVLSPEEDTELQVLRRHLPQLAVDQGTASAALGRQR